MRSNTLKMQIRDLKTKQTFSVPASDNTAFIITGDGVRVKLHPQTIRLMTKVGSKFDGKTLIGTREMERIT